MSLFDELSEDRQEDKKIVKSFKTKDSLSPDIFKRDGESFVMHADVRKQLLSICDNFIDSFSVEFFIHDIILTGSLANYNWSKYSDLDIHIILDMDEFGTDDKNQILLRNIFREFFDTKKDYWNNKHHIKIKNFDVEIYVQDLTEPHVSSGTYSLVQNKWLIEPEKKSPKIDDEKIISKAEIIQKKIDNLIKHSKDDNFAEQVDCLREKIRKFRKCGLSKGGEFSYENLVFKLLRRDGYIDKLLNHKTKHIDKKLSLNENPDGISNQINYHSKDAIPFGIFEDEMLVGFNFTLIPKDIFKMLENQFVIPEKMLFGKKTSVIFADIYTFHGEIPHFYEALYRLGIEKKPIDFESVNQKREFWRDMFVYPGRLWYNSKVISFWEYPKDKSEFIRVLDMLSKKMKKIYNYNINFNDYQIEVKKFKDEGGYDYELIPMKEYAGGYIDATKEELATPHLLPPSEKSKHPQMIDVKNRNIERDGEIEKKWGSLANRNNILTKNIAENK